MDSIGEITVFSHVVKTGSFANAAQQLGLTASGVSKKISRFENRLGVRLFNRTTRALSLTEAGQALFEQSQQILDTIESAESAARSFSTSPKGRLRIAAPDALAIKIVLPFLKEFIGTYPDISVSLLQGDKNIDLLMERVDVALMFDRPDETSFIARKMIDDPLIVCASPEFLHTHGTPATPKDLIKYACLTLNGESLQHRQWKFQSNNEVFNIEINSTMSGIGLTVKEAVLQGMGIARLPHFLVCSDVISGKLTPLFNEHLFHSNRAIYAVYPNREYLPTKTRLFIDGLYAHIHQNMRLP